MKFIFSARKTEVPDSVKKYAEKKFDKLDRYFSKDATATINFRKERNMEIVEATVQYDRLFFRAEEANKENMQASIDKVVDVIDRQIRKNKTRLAKRLRDGAFEREISAPEVQEEDYSIVRHKKFSVKPMSVDEAILQMNLLSHEFFFFIDIDTDKYCVIYKRDGGGYGLIESE